MKGLLFTYLLTYGGAAVSLFNPFYGLLIYVCFAIISPESLWFWSVPAGNYSRIVAIAMLIGWGLHGFGTWRFGRGTAIVVVFIVFWIWGSMSALASPNPDRAWRFIETIAKTLIPFLVGMTIIDSTKKVKMLAWTIMLSTAYIAYEMNLSYFEGFNRLYFRGFGALDNNGGALLMVSGFGLAFFMGLNANKRWHQALALFSAMLMAHAVMFSFSRGGLLALCITGGVGFLLIPKRPIHFLIAIATVLACFQLAGQEVRERFATVFVDPEERDASAEGRLDLLKDCYDVMINNPILGIGPEHWQLIAHTYGWPPGKQAHTTWMHVGAETGVVGLASLVLFYAICMLRMWSIARKEHLSFDPWHQDVSRMVISSLIGFIVAAQFISAQYIELPYYVVLIGAIVLKLNSLPELHPIAQLDPPPLLPSRPAPLHSSQGA